MGLVLRSGATTMEAIRRAIQRSQESLRALAGRHGINPKTMAKRKKRGSVSDLPTGPREPLSTVLSVEEEAIIVAFRKHTLLPLDDCLDLLQATIPHLTRSSLHRCLQRHGISRLPEVVWPARSTTATTCSTTTKDRAYCRSACRAPCRARRWCSIYSDNLQQQRSGRSP